MRVVNAVRCVVLVSNVVSDLIAHVVAMVMHLLLIVSRMSSFPLIVTSMLAVYMMTLSGGSMTPSIQTCVV